MNHTTLARIFAYFAGVLPVIQTILPSIVPPPYGVIAAGVIGVGLTAAHQIYQVINPPPPAAKVVTTVAKIMVGALFLPILLSLSACASLSNFLSSPTGQETIQAVVSIAVATAEQKGVPAAKINAIAKAGLAADTGTTATLATVNTIINSKLVSLPALDQQAVMILETALDAAIAAKVQGNTSIAQAQASISQVLQAVVTASGG